MQYYVLMSAHHKHKGIEKVGHVDCLSDNTHEAVQHLRTKGTIDKSEGIARI